jgi:hypothetical protein
MPYHLQDTPFGHNTTIGIKNLKYPIFIYNHGSQIYFEKVKELPTKQSIIS